MTPLTNILIQLSRLIKSDDQVKRHFKLQLPNFTVCDSLGEAEHKKPCHSKDNERHQEAEPGPSKVSFIHSLKYERSQ